MLRKHLPLKYGGYFPLKKAFHEGDFFRANLWRGRGDLHGWTNTNKCVVSCHSCHNYGSWMSIEVRGDVLRLYGGSHGLLAKVDPSRHHDQSLFSNKSCNFIKNETLAKVSLCEFLLRVAASDISTQLNHQAILFCLLCITGNL